MADAAALPADEEMPPRRRSWPRRIVKWLVCGIIALLLVVIGGVALLNTPLGERFLAERIAKRTFPNGLNIRIGRIEGNLYGAAVLRDVRLSDPKGVFLTIPRAEIDWNPTGWLSNRLEIDTLAARRGNLLRIPQFLPSEEDKPILPGFDISVDSFTVDNLRLAPGIAGKRAQRVDLKAEVQVEDRRLFVDADGTLGLGDRVALLVNAEPDGDDFDIDIDVDAQRGGAINGLLGIDKPYVARVRGGGTWREWKGGLLVRSDQRRIAALRLTNHAGRFGVVGRVDPGDFTSGLAARALGSDVSVQVDTRFASRVFDGSYALVGRGIHAVANGRIDLAENNVHRLRVTARVTDPDLFGPDLRMDGGRLAATVDGAFDDLAVVHDASVEKLGVDTIKISGLHQRGTARHDGTRWTLPVNLTAARVTSGNALIDPRLVNGTGKGALVFHGRQLRGDDLRIVFPGITANLALRGDTVAGRYDIAGPVRAERLRLANVGTAGGTAMVRAAIAKGAPFHLTADFETRIAPVSNATLANLAGPAIRARGGVALGGGAPIAFRNVRINAAKLNLALDGRVRDGRTTLAGRGSHADYGPFTVEAELAASGPKAALVFAKPYDGLENVRIAIAPRGDGFAIDTTGDSLLGPFAGKLGLMAPAGGPTRIDIETLTVSETAVTGGLTLGDGGASGSLALSGGGIDGTIGLVPRQGGQGLDIALTARKARFGGDVPLSIARADIRAQGLIRKGHSDFSGSGTAQGLSYGTLFIGRMAARGKVSDGVGRVDASLSGRRGGRFELDVNAQIRPEQVALAARGEFAGRRIAMPRRAVLSRVADGGWALAPTQVSYGDGTLVASGQFGGAATALELSMAQMPLSLIDVAVRDLGMGGTMSGIVEFRQPPGDLPTASVRVKVDDLTRSGLVLSSKPVDLALVARLTEDRLEARATVRNEEIQQGRLQARISGLPRKGTLGERLRAGSLFAQLRYKGEAESLWRLAAVDAFDLTGPMTIAADATGSLADPQVRGQVASDGLRVRSSLSGTDIREVVARGRFSGSRLQLSRFSGKAANGGTITGSGIVDLRGLGERVEGRFTETRGPTLDLRAAAANARLLDARGISATVTGPLRIVSNGLGGTIAGRVQIDRASWKLGTAADDLRLPRISTREINAPADRAPAATSSRPWRYLIDAKGKSRIDVEGMGLDSEWGADIQLRGTTAEPRIGGTAKVVRGDYTFSGTRFELTRGEIDFDVNEPIDPTLDIRAESEADSLTVEVHVSGSATRPEIAFSSTPALPEEELLSRLLFGGSITTLSATDALQLGSALASLRGGGGLDPINQLRSAIGLDRLRIVSADPALGQGTSVALGKNIGRRFYVEIVTDGQGYSATEVEFRLTSWLSLLGSVSTLGRNSVVAEISRDY